MQVPLARSVRSVAWLALSAAVSLTVLPAAAGPATPAVSIDWVSVGAPGNAPDTEVMTDDRTTGYGAVPYTYDIAKYLVTNAQYAAFLNKVAAESDPYVLYHPCSPSDSCYQAGSGIVRTGDAGSYTYSVEPGREL